MTKIARYLFGEVKAKTIATRSINGQHWYMARDICNLLGIANHSQAVSRERGQDKFTHDDSEHRLETIYIGGRTKKQVLMVNDNGMLKLILQGISTTALEVQEQARKAPPSLVPVSWQTALLKKDDI